MELTPCLPRSSKPHSNRFPGAEVVTRRDKFSLFLNSDIEFSMREQMEELVAPSKFIRSLHLSNND